MLSGCQALCRWIRCCRKPCWGTRATAEGSRENDYGKGIFSRSDFSRMAELPSNIQGRFIFSLNDRPLVRELFGKFWI